MLEEDHVGYYSTIGQMSVRQERYFLGLIKNLRVSLWSTSKIIIKPLKKNE